MNLLPLVLVTQLAAPLRQPPVLAFPQPGLDDTAAYQGYQTRFYRDAAGNTVQLYIEGRTGRVVHLLANADNESIAFTVRAPGGEAPQIQLADAHAQTAATQGLRTLSYRLAVQAPHVHLGWFLLGSMRVERDFQYWGKHRQPFASPPFTLEETDRLIAAIESLPAAERTRHLAALRANSVAVLRNRLSPHLSVTTGENTWTARVRQLSLDGRDSLVLRFVADTRRVRAARAGDSLSLQARSGDSVVFSVTIGSSARALTPLAREEIFTPEFLRWLAARRDSSPILERQARGVELLSSREKLMAGLPAYATYFGRDMLVSALMMRGIWRAEMSEFVIASVLRKLSPDGQVSHEEALGGQAVREAAAEYARLVTEGDRDRAYQVLRQHRRVRENYHMVDDELQFPILVGRWIADAEVSAARKRAFLLDRADLGEPRLHALLRELALVARMTAAYAAEQTATHLVAFAPRDSGRWAATSWRDSGVGYANGRFAMDVNAIYAPHALEAIATILAALPGLGIETDALARLPELAPTAPLGRYLRDSASLRAATDAWWNAWRHFEVRLAPAEIRARVDARLAAMPAPERTFWSATMERTGTANDSLTFLALSLDAQGRPIGVANTDPATGLFLGQPPGRATDQAAALRDVRLFTRAYPVGLLIEGVGPVVANDAYATAPVWSAFDRDLYHGPKAVWGREVNLFALGVARLLREAPAGSAYATELRAALQRVLDAADASGFQSELWSYEVRDGRVHPIRYGTGSDVQLWSTTDLAVQFALDRALRR